MHAAECSVRPALYVEEYNGDECVCGGGDDCRWRRGVGNDTPPRLGEMRRAGSGCC